MTTPNQPKQWWVFKYVDQRLLSVHGPYKNYWRARDSLPRDAKGDPLLRQFPRFKLWFDVDEPFEAYITYWNPGQPYPSIP